MYVALRANNLPSWSPLLLRLPEVLLQVLRHKVCTFPATHPMLGSSLFFLRYNCSFQSLMYSNVLPHDDSIQSCLSSTSSHLPSKLYITMQMVQMCLLLDLGTLQV